MLASGPAGYESPATRCKRYERIREWLTVPWAVDGVLVYVVVLTPTMSARRGPAREFFLRLKMRLTVDSIGQRIWKAIAGCSCSAPSGDSEDYSMGSLFPLATSSTRLLF